MFAIQRKPGKSRVSDFWHAVEFWGTIVFFLAVGAIAEVQDRWRRYKHPMRHVVEAQAFHVTDFAGAANFFDDLHDCIYVDLSPYLDGEDLDTAKNRVAQGVLELLNRQQVVTGPEFRRHVRNVHNLATRPRSIP